jgi:hypothetical protein
MGRPTYADRPGADPDPEACVNVSTRGALKKPLRERNSGAIAGFGCQRRGGGDNSPPSNVFMGSRLFRRGNANRDQRRVGRAVFWAAGGRSFAQELGLVARRPTIGRHQHFAVLALHRASRGAVGLDHADARARRTGLALRTRRTRRPRWTCRTDWPGVALRPLRACRTLIALRTFATARQRSGQANEQCCCNCKTRCTHFQNLPNFLKKPHQRPVAPDQTRRWYARQCDK